MNEKQFDQILEKFMDQIDDSPGSYTKELEQLAKRNAAMKEFKEVVSGLGESLGTIRLVIKYLVFDLEATRRERNKLRMKLEDMD